MQIDGSQVAQVEWSAPPGKSQTPPLPDETAQISFYADATPPGAGISSSSPLIELNTTIVTTVDNPNASATGVILVPNTTPFIPGCIVVIYLPGNPTQFFITIVSVQIGMSITTMVPTGLPADLPIGTLIHRLPDFFLSGLSTVLSGFPAGSNVLKVTIEGTNGQTIGGSLVPNQPPAFIAAGIAAAGTLIIVPAVPGKTVSLFDISISWSGIPGGNACFLQDTAGTNLHLFDTTINPPNQFRGSGAKLAQGVGVQLFNNAGVLLVVRGSIVFSQN
jgi:hypothetical protein